MIVSRAIVDVRATDPAAALRPFPTNCTPSGAQRKAGGAV